MLLDVNPEYDPRVSDNPPCFQMYVSAKCMQADLISNYAPHFADVNGMITQVFNPLRVEHDQLKTALIWVCTVFR